MFVNKIDVKQEPTKQKTLINRKTKQNILLFLENVELFSIWIFIWKNVTSQKPLLPKYLYIQILVYVYIII